MPRVACNVDGPFVRFRPIRNFHNRMSSSPHIFGLVEIAVRDQSNLGALVHSSIRHGMHCATVLQTALGNPSRGVGSSGASLRQGKTHDEDQRYSATSFIPKHQQDGVITV